MLNQTSKKKPTKRVAIFIIVILLIALIIFRYNYYSIMNVINPFRGEEKKQVKPIYEAAVKEITGVKLKNVNIDSDKDHVFFIIDFTDKPVTVEYGMYVFTDEQLKIINTVTEQFVDYLNKNDWTKGLYETYGLGFGFDKTTFSTSCSIKYKGDEAIFYKLSTSAYNLITDYYMMKDVRVIYLYQSLTYTFDRERAEVISKFKNLETIYLPDFTFMGEVGMDEVSEFARIIHKNNPDCRVYIVTGGGFILID